METGLQSYGWNLNDINSAKLVYINEYAFCGDNLTSVTMPELTHVIRTGAFENNKIETVQLGKYTAHVGDRAFKNNKIKTLTLADRAEEIGKEAFMNNEIESLTVKPWMEGYDDGLSEIPERAFANNKLTGVTLPDTITYVHKTAFDGNAAEDARFVITSDAAEITPTEGYDVRRTSGLLNKWTKTYLDLLDSFKNTIQIEKTEGTEDSTALIISNKDDNGGELPKLAIYVAKYNSNKLETVNKIEFADDAGSKAAIIPKQTGDYKIFIWTDNMQPVINPITSETNEPNKLF